MYPLKLSLRLFLTFLSAILLITFFGLSMLPNSIGPGQTTFASTNTKYWLRWANWDGGHYRGIAENGYLDVQAPFFPLYPMLIKVVMTMTSLPSLQSGLFISYLATIIVLVLLFKLTNLDYSLPTAQKVCILLLIFPTSFYLLAVYTEALFLSLTLISFYFARTNKFFISFICAGLASVTRNIGIIVFLCILLEYFLKNPAISLNPPNLPTLSKNLLTRIIIYLFLILILLSLSIVWFSNQQLYQPLSIAISLREIFLYPIFGFIFFKILIFFLPKIAWSKIAQPNSLSIIIGLTPPLIYLYFQNNKWGTPLAFINQQASWGRHLTSPLDSLNGYFHHLLSYHIFNVPNTGYQLLEFSLFGFFLILTIVNFFKFRISYSLYSLLVLLAPISTGTLSATPRYILVIFPVFFAIAQIKNETFQLFWKLICTLLLGLLSVMFIGNYWVT